MLYGLGRDFERLDQNGKKSKLLVASKRAIRGFRVVDMGAMGIGVKHPKFSRDSNLCNILISLDNMKISANDPRFLQTAMRLREIYIAKFGYHLKVTKNY